MNKTTFEWLQQDFNVEVQPHRVVLLKSVENVFILTYVHIDRLLDAGYELTACGLDIAIFDGVGER